MKIGKLSVCLFIFREMITIQEIWKDIEGYEGYYQVSNFGRVRSLPRNIYSVKDGRFLRFKPLNIKNPKETTDGYYAVTLSVDGNNKNIGIHILVAEAFLEKPDSSETLEVNHIDCNRKNNRADNLEWVSHRENVAYSSRLGHYRKPYGEDNPNYGNHILSDYYLEHPEEAERLARHGKQNGMHVELDLLNLDNEFIEHFDLMEDCARYIKEKERLPSSINSIRQRICIASKTGKVVYKKYRIKRTND